MKLIKTREAAGQVLCHDVTRIVKGVEKGPAFKKGHVITEEDIPVLLDMGKENIYIWEVNEDMLHENDAALILYGLCKSEHLHPSEIIEG
ncbi:MAG: molybdopterin-binding protein, partial [Lachnospiraceae bacterium]|nr:molybdopterin-binding protein [Lachnospiraceae bacterium]